MANPLTAARLAANPAITEALKLEAQIRGMEREARRAIAKKALGKKLGDCSVKEVRAYLEMKEEEPMARRLARRER